MQKQNFYFFTEKTFTEGLFESDEAAIAAKPDDCIRVMRAKDSNYIWTKPALPKPETE